MHPLWPLALGGLALFAFASSQGGQSPSAPPPLRPLPPMPPDLPSWPGEQPWPGDPDFVTDPNTEAPDILTAVTPPAEVMEAFIDQPASQAQYGGRQMADMARRMLTVHEPGFSAIVIPCDQRLNAYLPEADLLSRISDAMAESYDIEKTLYPAKWSHPTLGGVKLCAIAFHPKDGFSPSREAVLHPIADALRENIGPGDFIYGGIERYGNVLDLVVDTFVSSAVGTVSSLAAQDLFHAAGGERRLARLVRRYKRAKQRGDPRYRTILLKMKRTAERLKGRQVNWDEVEELIG